jgi:hypothetical protein
MNPNKFEFVGHVDPPTETDSNPEGLFYYIGPRKFPGGVYMPKGYDLEAHPGDDGWTVLRARCLYTAQVFCMWAVGPNDGRDDSAIPDLMEP